MKRLEVILINMTNYPYNDVVFVPGCLLCPRFQATRNENLVWRSETLNLLYQSGVNLVQMPCPEASFYSYEGGLQRKPHGIKHYEDLSNFGDYCNKLARSVAEQIEGFKNNGCEVLAVIGIEHSPTCAVNYMYTNCGNVKRKGLFMQSIDTILQQKNILIPIVGINRRYPRKSIEELRRIVF